MPNFYEKEAIGCERSSGVFKEIQICLLERHYLLCLHHSIKSTCDCLFLCRLSG